MLNPIPSHVDRILYPIVGSRMLELGRKKTRINGEWISYKSWFEEQGIDHTSIDIKGGYGSLALDLTKPLSFPLFDMVTNLGTTEHVDVQEPCWKNIHNLLKVNGVLVSMCPLPGDWPHHGMWYPTKEFYIQFAELNGYRIDFLDIGASPPSRNIDVRMTKIEDMDFIMPDAGTMFRNG